MDIEQDIAAALAGRAWQRDFVDGLTEDWRELTECFRALTVCAAEVAGTASHVQASDVGRRDTFSGAAQYLAPGAAWQMKAESVRSLLDASSTRVDTLNRRVHRDTVNIGVIGMTRAGKSTLLRRLSGLSEGHIPSNEYDSTTAAPSRIFHEPRSGQGHARLTLHTWETFRDYFLAPLHEHAEIAPPPHSLAGFRSFNYPKEAAGVPEGKAVVEPYRKKLRLAQESLPSYEALLVGGAKEITLDQLRPYIAYPAKDDPQSYYRPYHAVQSVDVFCEFRDVGAVRLGLVDLPGSGEAGLDVHGRFLNDMRNDVDLIFIIKRPEKTNIQVMDSDWKVVQLADDAASGVRRQDFVRYIINRDSSIPAGYLDRAVAAVQEEGRHLEFDVRDCDIQRSSQVTAEVLQPALAHLAKRLADMDRDAVQQVLTELREISTDIRSLCDELDRQVRDWLSCLPDEKERLRKRALELNYNVSVSLQEVLQKYDDLAKAGEPIAELEGEIKAAVTDIHDWLGNGLGEGSADQWLENFEAAATARARGRKLDDQYNNALTQVSQVFGRIDESLATSVSILWGEIAAALRQRLTERIIPDGPDPRAILENFHTMAADRRLRRLGGATERLLDLRTDYGNIFLRVGRPIIREIDWFPGTTGGSSIGATVVGGAVGGVVGHAVASVAGPIAGAAVGSATSAAVRQGIQRTSNPGSGQWWDTVRSATGTDPAPQPGSVPSANVAASAAARAKYPTAAEQYSKLVGIIEHVTAELEREFRAEARRAVRVLAAATEIFLFSATGTPGVELEFEKLCEPIQRELWPEDFGQVPAKVAADLAVLQDKTAMTESAASRVAARASHAQLL